MSATRNGYLFVFVSNGDLYIPVYFDNLQVTHIRGPILEETHYYPFGLTMDGISSMAVEFGKPRNNLKFNDGSEISDVEFLDGTGLNFYETAFRSYDPQIGRFHQIDPLTHLDFSWSPFTFALNNPILLNDALGLSADSTNPTQQNSASIDPSAPAGSYYNPTPTKIEVIVKTTVSKKYSFQIKTITDRALLWDPNLIPSSGHSFSNSDEEYKNLVIIGFGTSLRASPPAIIGTGIFITAVGLYYSYTNPSQVPDNIRFFGSPDNTIIGRPDNLEIPWEVFSKGGNQDLRDDQLPPLSNEALAEKKRQAIQNNDKVLKKKIEKEEKRRGTRNIQKRN